jgi:serine O-acetyltransferase
VPGGGLDQEKAEGEKEMNIFLTILIFFAVFVIVKLLVYRIFLWEEVLAALERDPAATNAILVIFTYPGLHAIAYYRIARLFHTLGLGFLARVISQFGRFMTGVEIHPAANIGRGLFIDHAMGVVIGETAVLGKNVTLFQGVTLGGTGKQKGKRHPTLGNHVVVGAGAKVLGNIHVGERSVIGANAVVVKDVPAHSTVVGVPGRNLSKE